jgi:hypothetical protein
VPEGIDCGVDLTAPLAFIAVIPGLGTPFRGALQGALSIITAVGRLAQSRSQYSGVRGSPDSWTTVSKTPAASQRCV